MGRPQSLAVGLTLIAATAALGAVNLESSLAVRGMDQYHRGRP